MKKLLFALAVLFAAHISHAQMQLNGAGATFPYVIYSKWFDEYQKKTGIQFNYQSIGSGGGIKQVIEGTVDFGATDGPMNDTQLAEAKGKRGTDILHIPTVMGAVVATYNLPGVGADLKISPEVLSGIYLGKITKWNDGKIAADNKGRSLPDKPIVVVHRSDGSGTTFIFVDYLSKVSAEWKAKVGVGTSVNWPLGLGGKGNEGVAGQVKQIEGSIGYVELAYAVKNNLPYASVKNQDGQFVKPSLESVTSAATGEAKKMPSDLRASITNAAGKNSYPISGFTWLLIYKDQKDQTKGKAIVNFLKWAFTDGQKYAAGLYYAPLPKEVVKLCEGKIASITFQGKPIR
ncbi:MAG TPA: phosphate ABC transporter substrate-binding protein PstS [Bacteroidota bacterium]|nr:phosphate ABC transporter substrate-binding protein PstS [Bacteroidota bacterium]